jgi:hypothetical protein
MRWMIILIVAAVMGSFIMWITGVRHMDKHFPDYKAEDFLNDKDDEDEQKD